jgi:stage II sporulation protein R
LPAGVYKSLIINLGESSGKNWWCVIFPEMCLPAANADLSETVSRGGTEIAEHSNRYKMRFKTVEIYEEIKNLFKR